jgi:hypothetical protein
MATTPKESLRADVGTNSVIRSNLGASFQVATIAALKAVTVANMVDGEQVNVVAYATNGDGGGGEFYYSSGSAATANDGTVIAPTSGSGRWLRSYSGAIDVKWFGATGDGATDDTSAINTAVATASASAQGDLFRVYFPDGVYMTDGIDIKSNVWLDFCGASINKRSNTRNYIIRAVETLVSGSYYGTYSNIKITGGFIYGNGFTATANMIRLLFVERLVIEGVTVAEYCAGNWAFALGGNDIRVDGCRTVGGDAVSEDGIHVMFGERITVSNCDLECGDDAVAIGGAISDAYQAADPFPLRGVSVTNIVVSNLLAPAVKVYVESGATGSDWEISDVNVSNISGRAGITRNGGIVVYDLNGSAAGTSQIQRVNISNVTLDVGSTTHDETNPYGVWLSSVKNVTLSNIAIKLTDKTAAASGFILCYVPNCENIVIDNIRCDALQRRSGIHVTDSNNIRVIGGKIVATTATTTGSPVTLDDVVNCYVEGLTILDANDGGFGITISTGTTTSLRLHGCRIAQVAGATTGSGITVTSATFTRLTITGNDFTGCVAAINGGSLSAGAAYLCADNVNFVTKSQGAASVTNGTTSIAVAHGLSLTPGVSNIQVTPTNNLGSATKFWISTPTSTQFTINVDSDPGVTTATFAWLSDVGKKPV